MTHDSLGEFVMCQVIHYERLYQFLLWNGFLDAETEGGLLFWRWDFWNGVHRRWLREHRSK